MIKVLITSNSPIKLNATISAFRKAFKNIEVIPIKSNSDINEQPIGSDETLLGARNRIKNGKENFHDNYDFVIGIENGIIKETEDEWFDFAWIVLEDNKGIEYKSSSTKIQIPSKYVEMSKASNYKIAAGELMSRDNKSLSADPHEYLTSKLLNRKEILEQTILAAIGQYLFKSDAKLN